MPTTSEILTACDEFGAAAQANVAALAELNRLDDLRTDADAAFRAASRALTEARTRLLELLVLRAAAPADRPRGREFL